jgi:Ca2+-binding EF-hand superfamily protein
MKTLALGLSLAVLAGCGVALAEQVAQPEHGWGGPGVSVTRAQAQEIAGRMFDRMDFNHDGKLDASDREGRRAAFRQAMFDRMDANHDGQISRDEFMNFKPGRPRGAGAGMDRHDMHGHDMHGPMGGPGMEGSGMEGSGMEGSGMGGPGGEGHMGMRGHGMGRGGMGRGGMGAMMMRMADTNHDGVVTRDEFMTAFMQHFDRMDTNHDGTVSPEERRAAHEAMRQHMHDRMNGSEGAMSPPPEGN